MYVRVTAQRAAQDALAGRMRPAGHSLPTSGPSPKSKLKHTP